MMRLVGLFIATCLTFISTPALAWDGAVSGTAVQIDLEPSGTNYGFRVYLEGVSTICTGGPDWAYINSTAANYQPVASALMLAYSSNKTVIIYSTRRNGSYCEIGYVTLRPPT